MWGLKRPTWVSVALRSAFSASLLFIALRFLLTPIRMKFLTNILKPDDYGVVTLLSMTAHGLALVFSLGGFEVLLKSLPGADEATRRKMFRGVLILSSALGLVMSGWVLVGWHWGWSFNLRFPGISGPAVAVTLILFLHVMQRIYYLLGRLEHLKARTIQLLWSDLWFLPLLPVVFLFYWNAERVTWIWCGWLLIVILATWKWVPLGEVLRHREDRVSLRTLLVIGLPILPIVLGEWILRLVGHYVLLAQTDAATMALYALALNIATVGYVAGVPLVDVFSTEFNYHYGRADRSLEDRLAAIRPVVSRCLRIIAAISIPTGLALVFLPEPLVRLLASSAFMGAADLAPWAAAVPLLMLLNLLLARILVAYGRNNVVGIGSLLGALTALLLCLLWIDTHGARGALLAIECALAVSTAFFGWQSGLIRLLDRHEIHLLSVVLGGIVLGICFFALDYASICGLYKIILAGCVSLGVLVGFRWVRRSDFAHNLM
jgi:O-antigen/teichoic acid export membrane protein